MLVRILTVLSICVLLITIVAWYVYKPVRIFLPSMAGVECVNENICIENPEQLEIAQNLYTNAKMHVQSTVTGFVKDPHFIFCESQSCFEGFGLSKASAQSFGTITTVVGPKGWKQHIIAHEMIHHVQNEQLGTVKFASLPTWFIEGMAYSFSQDPRDPLPEPWESHKKTFNKWYKTIDSSKLWQEASKL
ncbi:MAG: hypothetical protein CSA42_01970 [Gammaproteobacteria bacterium]|nr:MAG: hypothetical protein CSA42_01970 [Gammaproteobacteria bacterium]